MAHREICGRPTPYDWIVPSEDATLRALSELDWPQERRPKFLSAGDGQPSHFFSKIGLSQALSMAGIQTPAFRAVATCEEAIDAARELGYPVMLKVDASFGGLGVRECRSGAEILQNADMFSEQPLLIQKMVKGQEVALDATYVRRKLAHFAYAWPLRSQSEFGPSILRKYFPLPLVDEKVFEELRALGRALGADGFVNITCIDAEDGSGRYYIEADTRPNVWMNFARYCGDDPADRIHEEFCGGPGLSKERTGAAAGCSSVIIPYCLRMRCRDLVLNRYGVWKYTPFTDAPVAVRLLANKVYCRMYCVACSLLPRELKAALKRQLATLRLRFA